MEQYQEYLELCLLFVPAIFLICIFKRLFSFTPSGDLGKDLGKIAIFSFVISVDYLVRILIWGFLVMYAIEIGINQIDEQFFNGFPIWTVGTSLGLGKIVTLMMEKIKSFCVEKLSHN